MRSSSTRQVFAFELRQTCRSVLGPAVLVVALVALLLELQRPVFAIGDRRIGFLWAELEAATVVAVLALPLLWALARGRGAPLRIATPGRATLGMVLSIAVTAIMIGGAAATSGLTAQYTLHSITELDCAAILAVRVAVVAAPFAALAPGLLELGFSAPSMTLAWSTIVVASTGALGIGLPVPLDRLLSGSGFPSATVCLASASATIAGAMASTALVARARLR